MGRSEMNLTNFSIGAAVTNNNNGMDHCEDRGLTVAYDFRPHGAGQRRALRQGRSDLPNPPQPARLEPAAQKRSSRLEGVLR